MKNALLAVFRSHLTTEVKNIIHAMNTVILQEVTTQLQQVLVNKIVMTIQSNCIFEQPLAGDHILTANGKTKPSVELLCQWIKTP
jgi:hypothetical protein